MTADIQAAKERLIEFVAKPGLLTFGPYGSAHYNEWISAVLAELSRLEGEIAGCGSGLISFGNGQYEECSCAD